MARPKCKMRSPYGYLRRDGLFIHNGATGEVIGEDTEGYIVEFYMYPSAHVHGVPVDWVTVDDGGKKKSKK